MNDYPDSFQHFLFGFDQAIQRANPLKLLNYSIKPEFLQLLSFGSLTELHHLLEPHLQSPRAQSLQETPLVQKFQDEIVFRHLIRIPRDFSELRCLLETQFPEEPLTQALKTYPENVAAGSVPPSQAVKANSDWIQQEVAFLGELEQIRGQGSRFEEIIVKILNAFSPETGQNRASTHIAFVRRGEVGEVSATSPTLRPAILRKIATVGRPAGNAIFPDANIGSEFERAAYSIQFELKGEGLLEEFIEYRFVDALNYWDKFYGEGRSAGLAFAFLAFAYHNPLYHLLSPYLVCFGAYEDGIIKRVEAIREKVIAAQERGMRILILPESDVPQAQDCLQACQIIPYRVGTLREVLDSIAENTASLAKRLQELYPTQTDISIVPSPSEKSIQPLEGENRLVTALFAELSGATNMSQNTATEAVLEKVNQCRQVVTDAVSRYEGRLHGFTGDCVCAFFGAPLAHENAPEQAIRAALDMQEAVAKLGLNLSVGINTGMVYFGPIGTPEHLEISAYGPEINLAKRLQESANPGQILVGEGTYHLTHRAFEFQSQPPLTLKDIAELVSAYQVLKALPKPEKVRGIEGLKSPMIGRDEEFAKLRNCLDDLMDGKGQIISVIGMAGVGKSRLVEELKAVTLSLSEKCSAGVDLRSVRIGESAPTERKSLGLDCAQSSWICQSTTSANPDQTINRRICQSDGSVTFRMGSEQVGQGAEKSPITSPNSGEFGYSPVWLEGRCLSTGESVGYGAFIDILKSYFQSWTEQSERLDATRSLLTSSGLPPFGKGGRGDLGDLQKDVNHKSATSATDESAMAEKIIAAVKSLLPQQADDILSLFGNLLSVEFGNELDERLKFANPEQIKHQTFMALRDFFSALAQRQPLILVLEDLHWADGLSLDLIVLLMEMLSQAPLMLICVYRPEQDHKSWRIGSIASSKCLERYTEIYLRELRPQESRRMVEELLPIENLSENVKNLILTKSEGNPFFVEEVVRSLIDNGIVYREGDIWKAKAEIESFVIPDTIQNVILSRLDWLEEDVKYVLQCASVIGRLFRHRLLAYISQREQELAQDLWRLEDRYLIYEDRAVPELEYSFKHVLIQEAAYQSLLERHRHQLHRKVGEGIEALYPKRIEEFYEELAYHYDKSNDVEKAVEYLLQAGEKAKRSGTDEAAIAHFQRGLELLKMLPDTLERTQRELTLQIALGAPFIATKGYAASEVKKAYSRAQELCQQIVDPHQLFVVLRGLWVFYLVSAELQMAYELGEQLLSLANSVQDCDILLEAHSVLGVTLYYVGEFAQCREHMERVIALYDPQQHRSLTFLYGEDRATVAFSYMACAMWLLGYPNQALNQSHKALTLTQELAHPYSQAFALYFSAWFHQYCRDGQTTQELTEAMIKLSSEHGFTYRKAGGTILRGWALTAQGQVEEGIAQMRQGLAACQATGTKLTLPYYFTLMAKAYGKAGQVEKGLSMLAEALAAVDKTGERYYEAEMYRLKGELLLARSAENQAGAEFCFRQSLDVARRQQAKSLELRAVMSLSRLWQKQGKKEKARQMLQEIYGWFTEGFETVDLKEARALLEELSSN